MATRALLALLFLCATVPAWCAEVAGVKLADTDQQLVLNGAGLRKKVFFRVYVIGLYLPERKKAAADVLAAPGPKRIAIHMLRDVDAEDFAEALDKGIRENHDEAEAKALAPRIAQLDAVIAQLKQAREGMRITLDWLPASGTQLAVDGKPAGTPIAGEDFYRALLRIWLGDHPVQDDLKPALLGDKP
jgi:hypothetical protein